MSKNRLSELERKLLLNLASRYRMARRSVRCAKDALSALEGQALEAWNSYQAAKQLLFQGADEHNCIEDALLQSNEVRVLREEIASLTQQIEVLRERECRCATMDEAEKVALLRGLKEVGLALGLDNPSPAALAPAVISIKQMLRETTAVAVHVLYASEKEDVLTEFPIGVLRQMSDLIRHRQGERVETIFRRAWDASSTSRSTFTG